MAKEIATIQDLSAETVINLLKEGKTDFSISLPVQDSAEVAMRIAARDFAASSVEELFGGKDAISARDYVGRPFTVVDVEFLPSELPDSPLPFFAVIHGADLEGEGVTITTGAATIVRKIAVAKARGWLPVTLKITQDKTTENGYRPLDIVKVADSDLPF
jgi:hypothetical protein